MLVCVYSLFILGQKDLKEKEKKNEKEKFCMYKIYNKKLK